MDFGVNQGIELLPATSGNNEFATVSFFLRPAGCLNQLRKRHGFEMRLAIRRGEFSTGAQMRTAVLKRITTFSETLHALIKRHGFGNLVAHFPAGLATEQISALGTGSGRNVAQ